MKIAFLSGADKNAGDYLIAHRSKALLQAYVKDCVITEFARNTALDSQLEELNECDVAVFAGGPGYVSNMYPGRFPLVEDLELIRPKLFALGMGCRAALDTAEEVHFTPKTHVLLQRLEADGFGLGCRDLLTKRILEANGITTAIFTGCPAWYDLSKVDIPELLSKPARSDVRRIAVSDPAVQRNIPAAKYLVEQLMQAFPLAKVSLVFHRGWTEDEFTGSELAEAQKRLVVWAKNKGVEVVDIAYSDEGFSVYDNCDLQIGYRVHAHLYSISERMPSYLIEEDSRGYGASESLGCSGHISLDEPRLPERLVSKVMGKDRASTLFSAKMQRDRAQMMVRHVLNDIENGYMEADGQCKTASEYFTKMKEHVLRINHAYSDLSKRIPEKARGGK